MIDRDTKGAIEKGEMEKRKRERERWREGKKREAEGETGNLRSPSDCCNVEHLYVYKLYASRSSRLFSD